MQPPEKPVSPPPVLSGASSLLQAIRHVLVVLLTGMLLATVFTAWAPERGLLSSQVAGQVAGLFNATPTPTATIALTPTATTPASQPLIGIVAGHMGNDSGAVCPDGLTEAQVNLDIAIRVKAGLEASGFLVDLLDEFDQRLEGYRALALVSIHNDSCVFIQADPPATGFKVAGARDTGAHDRSDRLAGCLIDRYPKQTGLSFHSGSVTKDMTQYHTFYEVDKNTPVAIIETGFLNLDRRILTEEPQRVAQGVIDGILCFALNQPLLPTPTAAP